MSDWSALISLVTSLTEQALASTDALEAAAASSYATGSQGTLTAMKEAAAWSNRITEQYVAQIAMLEAATGSGDEPGNSSSCGRDMFGSLNGHVRVSSAASPDGDRRLGRHLRQSNSESQGMFDRATTSSSSFSSKEVQWGARRLQQQDGVNRQSWEGYTLEHGHRAWNQPGVGSHGAWGSEAADLDTPERDRWVGLNGKNKVVGGLFLHTTRKSKSWLCPTGKFAMNFALGCSSAAVPLLSKSTAMQQVLDYISKLFPGATNEVFPYGVDPVFLRSSSLYRPELVGSEGDYYNTSDPSEVSAATGVPYGYFPRALKVGVEHQSKSQRVSCSYDIPCMFLYLHPVVPAWPLVDGALLVSKGRSPVPARLLALVCTHSNIRWLIV